MKKYDYDVANELADKYMKENKNDLDTVKKAGFLRALGEMTIRNEFKELISYKRFLLKLIKIFDAMSASTSDEFDTFEWFDRIVDSIPGTQLLESSETDYDYIRFQIYQCFNSFTIGWGTYKDYLEAMEEKYHRDQEEFVRNTYPNFNYDPDIIN